MKNDDYGFYGKGLDGYVHYRQGMQKRRAMHRMRPRPPACLRRAENNRACTEIRRIRSDQQVDLQHPLHTACMISLFIALTCVIIESLGEPSIQFMAATAVICVVALIFLGIEVINFIIWFFKNC